MKSTDTTYSSAGSSDVALEVQRKVDVLFVIDDSGSMAEEQAKLAANFAPFVETLDAAGVDYRIAVTSTDDGGPGCVGGDGGRFVATSCLDRPEDFGGVESALFASTCAAHCGYTTEELGVEASTIAAGGELAQRPWLESFNGLDNLAEGVTALEAFQCLAPQGVAGCGYERTLESTARALRRSQDVAEPEHGFLRSGANLLVVIVTDEADCSFDEDHESLLFSPQGKQTFFADNYSFPSSAICWNAGVQCVGSPEGYDDCQAVDLDAAASLTSVAGAAMMHPVSNYVAELAGLAGDRQVMVSIIAGVPQGYASGAEDIVYRDPSDVITANDFGIDHGCTSGAGESLQFAIPPVRLAEFAEAFQGDAPNLFSVCADDYTPALEEIVDAVLAEFGPACFDGCLLDVDKSEPGLQESCQIIEERGQAGDERYLDPCAFDGEVFALPEGADACWILRHDDQGLTATELDDLDPSCQVAGQNGQFELLRRAGVAVEGGTSVRALCEMSAFPSVDCG